VNSQIIGEFRRGQYKLLSGKCVEAIPIKRRIVELMSVPLVQGALRYAYKVGELQGGSKEKAEGAAFSAAILPRIAACNPSAAQIISDNMKLGASMSAGFTAVKEAFESSYECLGITCSDVGGIIKQGNEYHASAKPCVTPYSEKETVYVNAPAAESTGLPPVVVIIIAVAGLLIASVCGFVAWQRGFKKGRDYAQFDSKGRIMGDTIGRTDPSDVQLEEKASGASNETQQ